MKNSNNHKQKITNIMNNCKIIQKKNKSIKFIRFKSMIIT